MSIDHSKDILGNAYHLWKTTAHDHFSNELPPDVKKITAIHRLTNALFSSMKKNKWYGRILSLFSRLAKIRISRVVKRALAAYKFDLVTTSTTTPSEEWLFNDNEKMLIKELRPIFKKHLLRKKGLTTIEAKARRWRAKVKKYQNNPRYLLASFGLTTFTQRCPKKKALINRVIKPFKSKSIKSFANKLLEDQDLAIQQGLVNLLGREDFNSQSPVITILQQAIHEIGKEKIKTGSLLKDRDPAIAQGVVNLFGREDFTFKFSLTTVLKKVIYEIGKQKIKNVKDKAYHTAENLRKFFHPWTPSKINF